jgi:hypothetical protein
MKDDDILDYIFGMDGVPKASSASNASSAGECRGAIKCCDVYALTCSSPIFYFLRFGVSVGSKQLLLFPQ